MLNLTPSKLKLTFFYDETNNIRKFYLTNEKPNYINTELTPFILGGIAIKTNLLQDLEFKQKTENLFRKLGLQVTQSEIKYQHIAKGDFDKMLQSKKLNTFFDFLIENKIFIHFYALDIIHWSLVDILESEAALACCRPFMENIDPFFYDGTKALLTDVARTFKHDFFQKLYEFNYPNIEGKEFEFIAFLKEYLNKYSKVNKYCHPVLLKIVHDIFDEFLKGNNDAFIFLKDEKRHILIDSLTSHYSFVIKQFPDSYLIFDEEKEVMKKLQIFNNYLNYKFVKSNDDKLIQLSDVLIGFIRCLLNWLSEIEYADVENFYNSLSENQQQCLHKFFNLYEYSVELDEAMVIFTWSIFDFLKFNTLRDLCKQNGHFQAA